MHNPKVILGQSEKFNGYQIHNKFDTFVEQYCEAECSEIRCIDLCNLVELPAIEKVLGIVVSKLMSGGKLIIGGLDIIALSDSMVKRDITVQYYNKIVFGNGYRGAYSLEAICELLKNSIRFEKKVLQHHQFIIEGVKI